MRTALEALKNVMRKFNIQSSGTCVYNVGTLREQKATTFTLPLEARIVNSEWDNLSEKALIKVLQTRFNDHLISIFEDK